MEILTERYELSCGRIREIAAIQDVAQEYQEYFHKTAGFILQVAEVYQNLGKTTDINVLRAENKSLYEDILGENYKVSYANPVYACEKLGQAYGPLLSFL